MRVKSGTSQRNASTEVNFVSSVESLQVVLASTRESKHDTQKIPAKVLQDP